MAITGLIVGATTMAAVARSISDPLASVRAGLQRVRGGDLDALVAVDDPGEVGLLQSGFNDMVEGLRERRVLEDLFGRHVGEEVARRAVRDGVELGGELREASVLMIDVIGSTSLARRVPPQDVVTMLNTFFAVVVNTVDAHGGWVNKFEGDAALCVFGVPDHVSDHSARALNAAVALARNLEALFGESGQLRAGVGVSGGVVVAGNVGSARRLEYTVIGDPVNEAARLADLAKTIPGRTVASETVIAMAAHPPSWRHDHDVLLRGRDVETRVYVPVIVSSQPSVGVADTPAP
jgi:adenylate cyclase